HPVDLRVPFHSLQAVKIFLESNRISYSIMIEDVQVRAAAGSGMSSCSSIYNWMDTLVDDHPSLVSKIQIGQSYENRPLYVLKFSTGGSKRPAIWLDTGIHSREWITQATGIWTANKVTTCPSTPAPPALVWTPTETGMLALEVRDGPPDAHSGQRLCLKASKLPARREKLWGRGWGLETLPGGSLSAWCLLCHATGSGSSSNPCSETYHGPYAHSEREVKAIVDFIRSHGNVKSVISIHSYSQMLMFPYGYKTAIPSCNELAKKAVSDLAAVYGTKYTYGSIVDTIYKADGTTIDWAYDNGVKYSFTFELRDTGRYGFLLPSTQIIPTATETWPAVFRNLLVYFCHLG
uniref:Peptidase M14 domain-containing protein n=1 Tax=Otus sunia TaxID=257818 RepID=A0A8C8BM40_9STRI